MNGIAIRPPEPDDASAVVEAVQESLDDLIPWMGWAFPEYGTPEAEAWIGQVASARRASTGFGFLIVSPDGGMLGTCGIDQINPVHRLANLGYWVRSSAVGRGIAVEAVHQVSRWAFANTVLERLEVVVAIGNFRSERVAQKTGAVREGVLRSRLAVGDRYHNATMYSIVRG